jgi:aryl-alcohol dehydrogenase-like predicted oxidoreductase
MWLNMRSNQSNKLDKSNRTSRLVLGTAQLGMNYGISNRTGQPDLKTAEMMVKTAWEHDICEFDTAQAYGQSEKILGLVFKELDIASEAKVITKLAPDVNHLDRIALNNALEISLNNLGVESLYGLMLHREDMLDLWDKGLKKNLMAIVDSGRVKHIGISVYSPGKAVRALNTDGISMVQLPTNIFDRRFEKTGVFDLADDLRKTIYIRSIFLQGLLLMSVDSLPEHMQFADVVLKRLNLLARDVGLNIKELCVGYIKNSFPRARLIFGTETPAQVKENLKCWNVVWPDGLTQRIQTEFEDIDEIILNPSLWPKGFANARRSSEVQ